MVSLSQQPQLQKVGSARKHAIYSELRGQAAGFSSAYVLPPTKEIKGRCSTGCWVVTEVSITIFIIWINIINYNHFWHLSQFEYNNRYNDWKKSRQRIQQNFPCLHGGARGGTIQPCGWAWWHLLQTFVPSSLPGKDSNKSPSEFAGWHLRGTNRSSEIFQQAGRCIKKCIGFLLPLFRIKDPYTSFFILGVSIISWDSYPQKKYLTLSGFSKSKPKKPSFSHNSQQTTKQEEKNRSQSMSAEPLRIFHKRGPVGFV